MYNHRFAYVTCVVLQLLCIVVECGIIKDRRTKSNSECSIGEIKEIYAKQLKLHIILKIYGVIEEQSWNCYVNI